MKFTTLEMRGVGYETINFHLKADMFVMPELCGLKKIIVSISRTPLCGARYIRKNLPGEILKSTLHVIPYPPQ